MKRHLQTLSLAALSLAAISAAQAQSEAATARPGESIVYGILAVDLLHVTNVYNGTQGGSQTRVDNSTPTASRLGFRGAEDLGGGLSAVFNIEAGVSPDTGASNATAFWNRGAYVGLRSNSLGTLTFGRQWNVEDGILGRYFIYAGYSAFKYSEFAAIDDLVNNAVKYVSPLWDGLQFRALVAPGEGSTGRTVEAGVNYVAGPLELGATYRSAKNLAGQADKLTSLGASYTLGPVRLHGGWASAQPQASGLLKVRAYDLGVVWNVTPLFSSALDYIARDQVGTGNDSHFWRLQGNYALSKRTALYANAVALTNKGTANQRFVGTGSAGKGQDVFGVGIRHAF